MSTPILVATTDIGIGLLLILVLVGAILRVASRW